MASLSINFWQDDNVKRDIIAARSSLSTRINDYAGIKKSIGNTPDSTGNLSTANTYIQKKINTLQTKYDQLGKFHSAVTTFNENTMAAERRVANRINTESHRFYKREGIKTGIIYTLGVVLGKGAEWLKGKIAERLTALITAAKTLWENIKQFYEDNKWWIDIVIDAVLVVAAIAAMITSGGFWALFFASWGFAKAYSDLCWDAAAAGAYLAGDDEWYKELSEKGLKDVMEDLLGSKIGGLLYHGMEIASAIYNLYKIGETAAYIFKDIKTLYKGNTIANIHLGDSIKREMIVSDIKLTIYKAIGISNLDAATGQMNAKNIFSLVGWSQTMIKNLLNAENTGSFAVDSIKLTSSIDKFFANGKSFIEKFFGIEEKEVTINIDSTRLSMA